MTESSVNKVVSVKLSSCENIIAEYVELDVTDGILILKNPIKLIQGMTPEGQDMVLFQPYDPASISNILAVAVQHVISLQPIAFRYKQQYVTAVLKHKLYDIEYVSENNTMDFLSTHMIKMCEDIGVVPSMDLMPISYKNIIKH